MKQITHFFRKRESDFKLTCTCRIRRVNVMFFLGKIDDITSSFTPISIQDIPMLIIFAVSISVFIQKKLSRRVPRKKFSENMQQIFLLMFL